MELEHSQKLRQIAAIFVFLIVYHMERLLTEILKHCKLLLLIFAESHWNEFVQNCKLLRS